MLTKDDLQQIGNVIDERLEVKLDERLDVKLDPLKKDLEYLKKKVSRIDKTLDIVVRKYDEGEVALHRRLTKVEKHLNLPQN